MKPKLPTSKDSLDDRCEEKKPSERFFPSTILSVFGLFALDSRIFAQIFAGIRIADTKIQLSLVKEGSKV